MENQLICAIPGSSDGHDQDWDEQMAAAIGIVRGAPKISAYDSPRWIGLGGKETRS
jgi:hypothetical protein